MCGWCTPTSLGHNRAVKLVTAIVHSEDAGNLIDALLEKEFRATRLQSSGGFLKQGNATIVVGVEDDQVDAVGYINSASCGARRGLQRPHTPSAVFGDLYMPY